MIADMGQGCRRMFLVQSRQDPALDVGIWDLVVVLIDDSPAALDRVGEAMYTIGMRYVWGEIFV